MNTSKVFNSNINTIKSQEGTMSEKKAKKISAKTLEFSDKILNSTTEEITDFLEKQTKLISQKGDSKLYLYKNFLLYRSNGEDSIQLEKNLELCKPNANTPKFVKFFQLNKNDFLSFLEISPSEIISYKQVANQIPNSTKQKFISDLQKINNSGLINRKIFTNKDLYFVTIDSKNIIFADWTEINFLSQKEKNQMNETLKNMKI